MMASLVSTVANQLLQVVDHVSSDDPPHALQGLGIILLAKHAMPLYAHNSAGRMWIV